MDYEKEYKDAVARMELCVRTGLKITPEYIFPELAESEDERMLREIKRYIKEQGDKPTGLPNGTVAISDMIAWLEKQEEEEGYEAIPVESTLEYKLGFKAGKDSERQKEQKPADDKAFEEWIDDWWKHNKVNNPDSYDKGDEIQFDERSFKNFCRGIRNMYQQEPAWSEEDEDKLEQCIRIVSGWEGDYDIVKSPYSNFLKSLRPQSKQEWSEKGEKILDSLIRLYGGEYSAKAWPWSDGVITYGDVVNFLKSLRPQPLWMPSKEQMDALERCIDYLDESDNDDFRIMLTLYEHLVSLEASKLEPF